MLDPNKHKGRSEYASSAQIRKRHRKRSTCSAAAANDTIRLLHFQGSGGGQEEKQKLMYQLTVMTYNLQGKIVVFSRTTGAYFESEVVELLIKICVTWTTLQAEWRKAPKGGQADSSAKKRQVKGLKRPLQLGTISASWSC